MPFCLHYTVGQRTSHFFSGLSGGSISLQETIHITLIKVTHRNSEQIKLEVDNKMYPFRLAEKMRNQRRLGKVENEM